MNRVVDELRPIAHAYAKRLGFMHQNQSQGDLTSVWLRELDDIQLELQDLTRSIRPMRQMLRHFIDNKTESEIGNAAKVYLEDVVDTLEEMLEDVAQLSQMAR